MDTGPDPVRRERGRGGHRRRRTARRIAIDILYQADVTERHPSEVIREWEGAGRSIPAYAREIAQGVESDAGHIDEILGAHAEEWTVPRMTVVDRTILRVACWELANGLAPAVAINEAVEAANELSTDDSGRFVNGVLGRIAKEQPPAAGDAER
jgi:N utilization substance protein B